LAPLFGALLGWEPGKGALLGWEPGKGPKTGFPGLNSCALDVYVSSCCWFTLPYTFFAPRWLVVNNKCVDFESYIYASALTQGNKIWEAIGMEHL